MSIDTTQITDVSLDTNEVTLDNTKEITTSAAQEISTVGTSANVEGYKKEYSIVGDGLYASVSADEAPTWLTGLIDAVVDASVAKGMTNYDLLVQDVRNAIDAIDIAKNTYVEQININALVDGIVVSKLETLNATYESNFATKAELSNAIATSEFSIAQDITDLSVGFGEDLTSRITAVQQAYADADSALADDITALESVFEDQENNLAATATAVSGLQTYVGVTENGIPDGTGILSSIALLQKQTDGLVETFVGAHELVNNDMDGDINTNELRVDQWPYALWVPMEGTTNPTFTTRVAYKDAVAEQYPVPEHTVYKNISNNTFWEYHSISYGGWEQISENDYNNRLTTVRDSHVGDTYVRYEVVNGVREYVESYKFIKDGIDNTIPYNTDRDGYSWAVVSNTPAEAAYLEALNAYALADGKISQFYAWGGPNPPADYTITNSDNSTETIPGDYFKYWFLNGLLKYFNGTSWADVPTNIGSSVHMEEGDLLTVFDPNTRDYTHYVFNGTSWQQNGPTGVISKSKFFVDLENEVTGANGHVASSLAQLEIDSQVYADNAATNVQNKFAYNSNITLNSVVYESGFGLNALGTTGSGTESDPYNSEFWINAEKFKFTNSNQTGQVAPFTIDASGTSPQITFNGQVSFNSVTSVPDYTLNSNVGASLTPPFTSWSNISNFTTTADNIKLTTSAGYPETTQYYPIDSTKAYKVRFRARPQAGCNGLLYFCLRQYKDKGVVGPANGGRSPYYPSAVTAAANGSDWKTYEYIWHPNDWQQDCIYVRPNFLNNYSGSTGYWEIQDFYMFEAADVTDYATISYDAQQKANTAESNAISAAADDATQKANTAQSNAEKALAKQAWAYSGLWTVNVNDDTGVSFEFSKIPENYKSYMRLAFLARDVEGGISVIINGVTLSPNPTAANEVTKWFITDIPDSAINVGSDNIVRFANRVASSDDGATIYEVRLLVDQEAMARDNVTWTDVSGRPTSLAALDSTASSKLGTIEQGADVTDYVTINGNIQALGNANVREYWAACYGSSSISNITYDTTENATKLYSSGDSSIGMCTPAQAKGDSTSFKITVTFKASSSVTSGVYFRVQELDGDLDAGKTHISNGATSSESRVQEDTRQITNLYENDAVSTSWQTKTFTYTPTSSAKYFSFLVLNWTNLGTGSLYIRNVDIVPQAPDISDQLPQTIDSSNAPTSSNVYPVGSIWRRSVTVNSTTQYIHYISQGGGTWRNVGGTYINGSDIITGSINASLVDVTNLNAGNITAGVLYNSGGTSSNYTMKIDLDNGSIHIK